jgi:hypothetical protein
MKQFIIQSKNGAENIRLSRLATRKSNLSEDQQVWQILSTTPCSNLLPVQKSKNGRLVKDPEFSTAMAVGSTLTQRIITRYADDFGVAAEAEVTREMIKELASEYLTWPERAQLLVCRDPSRQSIDEEVQKATLKQYLPNAQVNKPNNGDITLSEGKIVNKSASTADARSVDFVVDSNGYEFNIFAKYSAVSGSGQTHQADESRRFIQEAIKYVKVNNDNKFFIALTDGKEGESHLPDLNAIIKASLDQTCFVNGAPRIFAGNCENVIDFIESIK